MSHHEDWFHPADVTILTYLSEEKPDYVPLIASHRGLHLGYAQRRIERLAADGLVESVSAEVVYRITEKGEATLESRREAHTHDDAVDVTRDDGAIEPVRDDRDLAVPRRRDEVEVPRSD